MVLAGGDEIRMRKGSFMMIHEPETVAGGRADDLRKDADLLEKMRDEAAEIYVALSKRHKKKKGKDMKYFVDAMEAETWYSADEALEIGLIGGVLDAEVFEPVEDSSDRVEEYLEQFENTPLAIVNLFNKNNFSMKKKNENVLTKIKNFFKSLNEDEQTEVITEGLIDGDVVDQVQNEGGELDEDEQTQLRTLLEKQGKSEEEINAILASSTGEGDDVGLSDDEQAQLDALLEKGGLTIETAEAGGDAGGDNGGEGGGDAGAGGDDAGGANPNTETAESAELVQMRKENEELKKKNERLVKMKRKQTVTGAGAEGEGGGEELTADQKRKAEIDKVLNKKGRVEKFDKLGEAMMESMKRG